MKPSVGGILQTQPAEGEWSYTPESPVALLQNCADTAYIRKLADQNHRLQVALSSLITKLNQQKRNNLTLMKQIDAQETVLSPNPEAKKSQSIGLIRSISAGKPHYVQSARLPPRKDSYLDANNKSIDQSLTSRPTQGKPAKITRMAVSLEKGARGRR